VLVVDRRQERRVLSYALCDEPCSLSYAMHCVMLKARVAAAVESGVPAVIRNLSGCAPILVVALLCIAEFLHVGARARSCLVLRS